MIKLCIKKKKIFFIFLFFFSIDLKADKIFLKDGRIMSGKIILLRLYQIVLRERSGQKVTVMQSEVRDIIYDDKEKTFLRVGNHYFSQNAYQKALRYYEKALKINPTSKTARNEILKIKKLLFTKKRKNFLSQETSESHQVSQWIDSQKKLKDPKKKFDENLYKNSELGLTLKKGKDSYIYVSDVDPHLIAARKNIFIQDQMISINGKKVNRMSLSDCSALFYSNSRDQNLDIKRKVVVLRRTPFFYQGYGASIDGKFKKIQNGFIFISLKKNGRSDLAGLKKNDVIMSIDDDPTQMMSEKNFYQKLQGASGSKLHLEIIRHIKITKISS